MGRARIIDRAAVLDAAQKVVSRDGAARLTLDAVATEAGISKASVLYDYKSKHELMKAVIERRVAEESALVREAIDRLGSGPNAAIRGRIAAATRSVSDEDRAVALNLCAALAADAELSAPVCAAYRARIEEVLEGSEHPRGALLAFLATEGMMLLEWFGLHSWPADERERLTAEICWLIEVDPEPAAAETA